MSKEAMKLALEALESCGEDEWYTEDDFGMSQTYDEKKVENAITSLRQAIAEAEKQEPVAWMWKDETITTDPDREDGTWTPLYTHPQPKREWVGLTDEEIEKATGCDKTKPLWLAIIGVSRAVEAKLKEKNT